MAATDDWGRALYPTISDEALSDVAPEMMRAEARRRAEEIYNRLTDVVKDAMDDIRHFHGRDMQRLVLRELVLLESRVTAASTLAD